MLKAGFELFKKAGLLCGLLIGPFSANACDVCGSAGASGAFSPGSFLPENQLLLNYHFLSFRSRHLPSILQGQEGVERTTKEAFHLAQAGVRWSFAGKWQGIILLPYQHVNKWDGSRQVSMGGLGDIQVGIAHYQTWDSVAGKFRFQVMGEYSLKLPTGRFDYSQINEDVSRYMLPGSGSLDHLFRVLLQVQRNSWRVNAGGLFRYNGTGPDSLNWGNRWQWQAGVGREIKVNEKHAFFASLAYLQEGSGSDYQKGSELPFSAYYIGLAQASVVWRYKKMATGVSWFQPLHGALGDGRVDITSRCLFQVVYYPGGKKK